MKRLLVSVMLGLMLLNVPAVGQGTRGSLTGLVKDPTGAAILDAAVTAKNNATAEEFRGETDSQGAFVFPSLPVGLYTVAVEAKGFKRAELPEVLIEVSTSARVTIDLEIGNVTEEVTVTGEAQAVVNTVSPVLNNVVNTRQVTDLPLPGRNPLDLARLQAGIAVPGNDIRNATVAGLRGTATNITHDGVNVMDNVVKVDSFFAISAPTVEAVSEFSVSVGTTGSDAGRGVAQVRIVTPSGSNELHGSVFLFHRNDNLHANSFANNANNLPKNVELQNRFGYSAGGPVYIPKVYDGRNKTFWFTSYQGFREPFTATASRTVLTEQARRGLFRYVDRDGNLQTINLIGGIGDANARARALNPLTAAIVNSTPLPNDTQGLIGDGLNTGGFRFQVPGKDSNDRWSVRVDQQLFNRWGSHKLEYVLHRATFLSSPDFLNGGEPVFPGGVFSLQSSTRWNTSAAIHSTFGATATNEVRYGHQRAPVGFLRSAPPDMPFFINAISFTDPDERNLSNGRNTTVYHFQDNFAWVRRAHTFRMGAEAQSITFHNFTTDGTHPTVNLNSNTANPTGILNADFPRLPAGTAGTNIAGRARSIYVDLVGLLGSAQQTFFVTDPQRGFTPGAPFSRPIRQRDVSLYFQDQWRVKRNLTLNYGLRWEYLAVPEVLNGLALLPANGVEGLFGISGFGNVFNPGVLRGTSPTLLDFAGGDTGRPIYNDDWNNFAPFIGFAYAPKFRSGPLSWIFGSEDGKSSIRGGFSISYLRDGLSVFSGVMGSNPGLTLTPAVTNPVGTLTEAGLPVPVPPFRVPLSDLDNFRLNSGNGIWTFDPNLRTPYVQQWSFGIEREIARGTAIEARYVGNHGVKLWRGFDFNEVNIFENGFLDEFLKAQRNLEINGGTSFAPGRPGTFALPTMAALFQGLPNNVGFQSTGFINALLLNNVGGMASTLANSTTYANTRTRLAPNFFRVNPNAAFARVLSNLSFSNYHSLQLELRRRFSRGVFLQANYTFSKALTDSEGSTSNLESFRTLRNFAIDRHRAGFDQTHRFISNFIYEIPVGPGRSFLNSGPGVVRKMLEGWQIGGIVNWQSGQPISVTSGRSTFNNLNPGLNPANLVGMSVEDFRKNVGVFKTPEGVFYINPLLLNIARNPDGSRTITVKDGLFEPPAPGAFGTFPRNFLNSANYYRTDFSVMKRTRYSERGYIEFRAEFFNLTNHTNFFPGSFSIDSESFGVIGGSGAPREIQLGLRINW
jgi:hypothetical protein